jgi:hypothetical protein
MGGAAPAGPRVAKIGGGQRTRPASDFENPNEGLREV